MKDKTKTYLTKKLYRKFAEAHCLFKYLHYLFNSIRVVFRNLFFSSGNSLQIIPETHCDTASNKTVNYLSLSSFLLQHHSNIILKLAEEVESFFFQARRSLQPYIDQCEERFLSHCFLYNFSMFTGKHFNEILSVVLNSQFLWKTNWLAINTKRGNADSQLKSGEIKALTESA